MGFTKQQASAGGQNSKRGKDSNAELIRAQITGKLSIDDLFEKIYALEGKDQVDALIKLIGLVLPRMQNVTANVGISSLKDFDKMDYSQRLEFLQNLNK